MPQPTSDTESLFVTPDYAARVLNVSTRTIYRLLQRGELEGRKVGHQWRIRSEALEGDDDQREEVPAV